MNEMYGCTDTMSTTRALLSLSARCSTPTRARFCARFARVDHQHRPAEIRAYTRSKPHFLSKSRIRDFRSCWAMSNDRHPPAFFFRLRVLTATTQRRRRPPRAASARRGSRVQHGTRRGDGRWVASCHWTDPRSVSRPADRGFDRDFRAFFAIDGRRSPPPLGPGRSIRPSFRSSSGSRRAAWRSRSVGSDPCPRRCRTPSHPGTTSRPADHRGCRPHPSPPGRRW